MSGRTGIISGSRGALTDDLVAALARAQAKFPAITKAHTNPHYKSKYADLSDVLAAVRPVLAAESVFVSQPIQTDDEGRVTLETSLAGYGERLSSALPLYLDGMTPQQLGSTLTYYRRYMLASMLGVAAEDDDDGNAAQPVRKADAPTVIADTAVSLDKPLEEMSVRELHSAASQLGHTFSGAVSKAEMVRQLLPLWKARNGDEPWDMTPTVFDLKEEETSANPVVAVRASLTGSERKSVNSAMKAEQ